MKRYISAILIPCLLMQFFGCYSSNYITVDQLVNEEKQDVELTTFQDSIYTLETDQYKINDGIIYIDKNPTYIKVLKIIEVPINDVKQIKIQEFNLINTIILVASAAIVPVSVYIWNAGLGSGNPKDRQVLAY